MMFGNYNSKNLEAMLGENNALGLKNIKEMLKKH